MEKGHWIRCLGLWLIALPAEDCEALAEEFGMDWEALAKAAGAKVMERMRSGEELPEVGESLRRAFQEHLGGSAGAH